MFRIVFTMILMLLYSCSGHNKVDQLLIKVERKNLLNYPNDPGYVFFSLRNNTDKPIYFNSLDIDIVFKSRTEKGLKVVDPVWLDYYFTVNDKNRDIKAQSFIKKEWTQIFNGKGEHEGRWITGRLIYGNDSLRVSLIDDLEKRLNSYIFLESDSIYTDYIDLYPFFHDGYNNVEINIAYKPHGTDLSGWDYTFIIPDKILDYHYLADSISEKKIHIDLSQMSKE